VSKEAHDYSATLQSALRSHYVSARGGVSMILTHRLGLSVRQASQVKPRARSLNNWVFSKSIRFSVFTLALFCTRSFADFQTPHVHLEAGSTRTGTLEATCGAKKCVVQMRSVLLKVKAPTGKSSEFVVHMLHDPGTKLFAYHYFQTYQGFDLDRDRKMFASSVFVYVGPHQLVIFKSYFGPEAAAWKGTETYSSMDGGQASVLRFFEAHRATAETELQAHANKIELMKKIPRQFMEQCYNAMAIYPKIENLGREADIWKFTLRGPNGNSAEISVDDSFTVVSTKLIPRPDVIVLDSVSFPAQAFHEGTPARLQAHEMRLRIANGCYLDSVKTVLTVFDPDTKLCQWFSPGDEDSARQENPLPDEWANRLLQDSIVAITEEKMVAFSPERQIVQESSSRFGTMQGAEQDLVSRIAKRSRTSDVAKGFPLNFAVFSGSASCDSSTWRSVTREAGRWRLQLGWTKGLCKNAAVFLDDNYKLLSEDLAYSGNAPEPYGSKNNPLLMSLLRAAKRDPVRSFSQSELKITDKSSSIHALKNGRPAAVVAHLVEIGRTDLHHPLIGKMLAVYEPTSKLFWCMFEAGESWGNIDYYSSRFEKGESWLVITDNKIVGFDGMSNNNLIGVVESGLRYPSFSEGLNRALAVIWQNVGLVRDGHRVFDIPLPEAFFVPDRTKPRLIPHYAGISQQGHNWQLVFEQSEGQRAVVTLSEQYEPIGASISFVAHAH